MNRYDIKNRSSQQITHSYMAESPMPAQPGWGNDYDVIVTDLTDAIKAEEIAAFSAMKDKQCDDAVKALLAPNEDVTHIMFALFDMYTAMNVAGDAAQADIDAAKANLAGYLNLMGQIQALRAQRDADVAAYIASRG